MKFKLVKLLLVLPFVTAANTNYADVKLSHIEPSKADALWIRAKQFTPMYPIELAMKGISGCGVFKVVVNEKGETAKVELVSSIPKKKFFKPVKKVIKKWTWKNVSGQANALEEKHLRLDFCMGGKTEAEAKARCAEQAKLACKA